MAIELKFKKGSLSTQVLLKDEALAGLLTLISEHQSDEIPVAPVASVPDLTLASTPPAGLEDRIAAAKNWLLKHAASELLNIFNLETYPEKILLLGAFHESKTSSDSWRNADMEMRFSEAKEPPPANFSRDITNAIKQGKIGTVTPRTYRLTRSGWNFICDLIQAKAPLAFMS